MHKLCTNMNKNVNHRYNFEWYRKLAMLIFHKTIRWNSYLNDRNFLSLKAKTLITNNTNIQLK